MNSTVGKAAMHRVLAHDQGKKSCAPLKEMKRSALLNSTKRIVGRLAASARRDQAHRVTLGAQEAPEVVRATARFHSHDTGRHRSGEGGNILQPDSPLDDCASSLSKERSFSCPDRVLEP